MQAWDAPGTCNANVQDPHGRNTALSGPVGPQPPALLQPPYPGSGLEFRTWGNVVALGALLVMVLAGGISCALALGRGRTTVLDEPPAPDGAPTQQATEVTPPGSPRPPQRPEPSPAQKPEPPEPPEAPAAQQAAQQRQPLPPLPVIQLDETSPRSELDTRSFSLLPIEPLPITDLLLRLVRDTDLSVVPDPDVEGTFVGELRNVTLRQVLDLMLRPLDLDYSVRDSFIRVFKRPMETRIFEVDYVPTRRVARRSMIAASTDLGPELARVGGESAAPRAGVGDGVDGSWTQVTASEDSDLFQELAVGVQMLLSEVGKLNLDQKAALLQVTDFPDRLEKMGVYLETVRTRVQRQVQIQASVIELELHDEFNSGIDWPAVLRDASDSGALEQDLTPVADLTLGLRLGNVDGLLRALSNQGTVNVLSRPRVVAMNNEPVVMRVGTRDVFFVTISQVDGTGRVLQRTTTPRTVTEGVVLTVTPQISADGIISMSVRPRVTVLPLPDSPTSPSVSPLPMAKLTPSTTIPTRPLRSKTVVRLSTCRRIGDRAVRPEEPLKSRFV